MYVYTITTQPPLHCPNTHIAQIWDFTSHAIRATLSLGRPVTKLKLLRNNNFAACVCARMHASSLPVDGILFWIQVTADYVIHVIDCDTHRVVRLFTGHTGPINDVVCAVPCRAVLCCAVLCCAVLMYPCLHRPGLPMVDGLSVLQWTPLFACGVRA